MEAIDTATSEQEQPQAPVAVEVAEWALDGRFFTVDTEGAITSWSPLAIETFGWKRNDAIGMPFVDTLLGPDVRHGKLEMLSAGGVTEEITALDAGERTMPAVFGFVPIKL